MKKSIYIISFIIFGLLVGFLSIWQWHQYDTPPYINLPGILLGEAFHGLWTRFIGEIKPWIMGKPQVYVLSSVLLWGLFGALLTVFVKPKVINWIVGIYLVIFGGLSVAFYLS